jgi:hypothetical protein
LTREGGDVQDVEVTWRGLATDTTTTFFDNVLLLLLTTDMSSNQKERGAKGKHELLKSAGE